MSKNKSGEKKLLNHQIHFAGKDKKWIVFVHGAGGAIATWNYQINAFQPHFNLLLLDLRDHGLSKDLDPTYKKYNFEIVCNDVLAVIDNLEIKQASFITVSMGSMILQKIDVMRPQLIEKMVVAGGIFKASLPIKILVHSAKILSYILSYRQIYTIFSYVVLPRKNHKKARRIYRLQSMRLTPKEYLKWIGLYKDFFRTLKSFFKREIATPCLVVMGSQDHVFLDAAIRFCTRHPSADLHILEKCGHVCNIERPEDFNQLALNFLKEK